MKLQNKVALITGGGYGIGRVIALRFATEGAKICVAGRSKEKLDETVKEMESKGTDALAVQCDITRENEVESMVNKVVNHFGSIDVLVNNAAAEGPTLPIHEMESKDWRQVVDVNLNGLFYCTKYVLKEMIPRETGNILNIGSIAGVYAYPLRTPYNATKWAIAGVTQTIAAEVGPYNIRCNCLSPGPTEGERSFRVIRKRADAGGKSFEEMKKWYEEQIPIRRFISPEEVASSALFLVSGDSSGVTAQHFCVSGGLEVL